MKNGMRVIDCEHHFSLDVMMEEFEKSMSPEQWDALNGWKKLDEEQKNCNSVLDFEKVLKVVADIDVMRLEELDRCGIEG